MIYPNMIWERRKVKLLNDAKVVLNLKFPREDFEVWLQMHNINACRVFGTKVTFHIMKQAAESILFWNCIILSISRRCGGIDGV